MFISYSQFVKWLQCFAKKLSQRVDDDNEDSGDNAYTEDYEDNDNSEDNEDNDIERTP